ncbi:MULTISPECIES: amidophosphoribosyltransferase [Helicobacter]|uniref:Amidophosphoribosyltransferase n=1 Tax=Helicobacter ibis TaxID=2962633 RepID=A0ABT4VEC4_9HELI|nr:MULTISPECIES: amidophosphoribosyltransferase [Helicobacter]MDA3967511.1 amidophosphoribosyltransferase [Helicobacter sp. WB40]MDA3969049.1 amidophosphoribosyltransferase [Helicobacter ibis]
MSDLNYKSWNEECAVVGVYNIQDASNIAYYSLFAMQHRGQEASGISTSDNKKLFITKNKGLVTEVFNKEILCNLKGNNAIGHNRYATAGEDSSADAQPVFANYDLGQVAIVHNGNITNAKEIKDELIKEGAIFQSHMDTEVLIHLIAKSKQQTLTDRLKETIPKLKGAFCFIILSRTKMFVIRDRNAFRPLSLGEITNKDGTKGYIVASETCAFDLVGATHIRDVEAGEMLVFDKQKIQSHIIMQEDPYPCVFEYVYFARPDSKVFGRLVYDIRKSMGMELAKENPVDADIVIPVPDSGVAAALGYSKQSGIPFELGIIRNHYVGRTFIEPTQEIRELKVRLKLNPIKEIIKDKKIIVIDDSIVRGTTSKQIVKILRDCGAKEIHMKISSPPTISPCYYGVDTPTKSELISANMSNDEVCKYIGANSLSFLSLEGLKNSIGDGNYKFCQACFDGKYIV